MNDTGANTPTFAHPGAFWAEVLLPLPLQGVFTYHVPSGMNLGVGARVVVPFGSRKYYTGIVQSLTPLEPPYPCKDIAELLDTAPIVRHPQLKLWQWIADYYMCTPGEVMKAALPAGLKLESETMVEVNPDFIDSLYDVEPCPTLSDTQLRVVQTLSAKGAMRVCDLSKTLSVKNLHPCLTHLVDQGILLLSERIEQRFRPIFQHFVTVNAQSGNPEALNELFAKVKGAPKQELALMTLIQLSGFTHPTAQPAKVTQKELMERAGVTVPIIKALEQKGAVKIEKKEVSTFSCQCKGSGILPELSSAQQTALQGVNAQFRTHNTVLLHGVTSSGKTELYLHLMDHVLKQGRQVLFLVPEIALTTQLTTRIQQVFGNKVTVYHSKFSDRRRTEIWQDMLRNGEPRIVIGVRSSVFLPFSSLGLVIVDEEHEPSYKQFDPAPRYSGRDVAMVLAQMHGAKTLLGSATPSIETYYKAQQGKFGLVTLSERYAGAKLPTISIVDMSHVHRTRSAIGPLAPETLDAARKAVENDKQVIFFQNRRGYAPVAHCTQCEYVVKCPNCDVSMTYHKYTDRLECHYCGNVMPKPALCPVCKHNAVEIAGYGTERVEDEIEKLMPKARTLRMDLDTTRNKDGHEKIIERFSSHQADVLIGTQMVTKGLDFGLVSTVVVVNADSLINFPDFRAGQRAFNMLEQVAGRSGRREGNGRVIIQTSQPHHQVIQQVVNHDFQAYYASQLAERKQFSYPPFTSLIYIYLRHRDRLTVEKAAGELGQMLRGLFGNRVFGPEEPQIARIQNQHIRKIMLKFEPGASMARAKELLHQSIDTLRGKPEYKALAFHFDVDPQ